MPNVLDASGLTTSTQEELIIEYESKMKAIYGIDINIDQSTPDGQQMMITIQMILDQLDLITSVYNSFDPDKAMGVTLDHRIAMNGIQRQEGTSTITPVTIVTTKALTLPGTDQANEDVYTVSDNAGNNWLLVSTEEIAAAGTYIMNFEAFDIGARTTIVNTITVPVTIVLGVSSINNPTPYTSLGINEESDQDAQERRQKSVAISSEGYYEGLVAALENINGISSAFVNENKTSAIDADLIPSHSIWVITSGNAPDEEIATVIYKKRNSGCGMKGAKSFVITQTDGTLFTVRWDTVTIEDLYINATLASIDGINSPKIDTIRNNLTTYLKPEVGAPVNVNSVTTAITTIDPNSLVSGEGVGLSSIGPWLDVIYPTSKDRIFEIDPTRVILLPMVLTPQDSSIDALGNATFYAQGGFGAIVYIISVNNSGGSIGAGSGAYVAGAAAGIDTIRATDSIGNTIETTVTVI